MIDQPSNLPPAPVRRSPLPAAIFLSSAVLMCAIYANLSLTVTNPAHYRFRSVSPSRSLTTDTAMGGL